MEKKEIDQSKYQICLKKTDKMIKKFQFYTNNDETSIVNKQLTYVYLINFKG